MTDIAQSLIDELDDVLDQERQALLQGDLEDLARLMTLKEGLIDRLNKIDALTRDDLDAVQGKVTRNQALLTSAMEGIRAVADRMADLRRVRRGLETYDRAGRKKEVGIQTAPSVEKRA